MKWLLNSAVVAAGAYGTYRYEPASVDDLRAFLDGHRIVFDAEQWPGVEVVISRIGYSETADQILRWTGMRPGISRETSAMAPGDEAIVVRLRYRVDPREKVAHRPAFDAWEIGRLTRES